MTLHVRPTCGTWAVFLPLADGRHEDKIYTGLKADCDEFVEFFRRTAAQNYSLFGIDDEDLEEMREEFRKTRLNAFEEWLFNPNKTTVDLLYK